MRALIRKSQERHMMQPRSHQTNGGDILLNMVSSATSTNSTSNQGNLLSRPSPFLESGGGQSNQFSTDFDVKLNVRSKSLTASAASSSNGTSGVQSDNTTDVKMEDLCQKPPYVSNSDLDPHQNYLETPHNTSNVECTTTNNNQGNLFSITPEKASPLTNTTVPQLGNVFSQAVSQTQQLSQASSTKVTGTATPPTKVISAAGPPASGGGKPNAMLMNLLNDVPQGQPMSISGSTQNLKPRKQRKRKALGADGNTANSNNSSPRSTTGRSPKRKISEDDGSGKDALNLDAESNDSLSVGFPEAGHTASENQQNLEAVSRSEPPDIASTLPEYSDLNFSAERNFTPSVRLSNFHVKAEVGEFKTDTSDSKSTSGKNDEKPIFTVTTTTNLSAKSSGSSSSSNEKLKEIVKKVKKPKVELMIKEEKDISLGKEIEKIPIVFDITSSVDGRTIEVSRNIEHVDRRPNVEIIPLGTNTSTTTSSSNVQTTTAALNAFNSSLKMNKSDSKDLFKRVRRIVSSDNLERKNKVDGKKDRKRKRVESADGLDEVVLKAPKIINLITPIPSNTGISVLDKSMAIVTTTSTTTTSMHKHESVMRPVTLNMKSPLGSSTNTSTFSAGSKTSTTPTGTVKRNFLSSPTVSPTLSVSPNKPVSILKASQHQHHPSLVNKSKQNVSKSSIKSNHSNDVNKVHMKVQNKNRMSSGSKNTVAHSISGGMSSSGVGKVPTKPATVKLKQLNLNQSGSSSAPTTPTSSAPSTPRAVTSPSVNQRGGTSLSNSGGLVLTSIPTSPTMSGTTLAISPNSLSATSTNSSGGNNLVKIPMSAVNAVSLNAIIAAQKVNKSAVARSRKGSLSAVIDKLMASSMQHTGGVGDSPQLDQMPLCKSDLQNLAAMKIDGLPEKYQLKKEGQSGQSQAKGQTKVNQSDSGGGGGKNAGDTKKAEFTVKQSSQGIKLTVTKTHCSESGSKPSVRGSKFGSGGSFHKSGSPSKFSGSSTGLKPGVNSGPASKKPYTPPSSKSSANGSVSPNKSLSQSGQSAVQKTSISPVPSLSNTIFSPNKSSSNSSVPRPGKFASGSGNESKTSSSNKSPKSQDNRPPTPKMISISSSTAFTMPPPPPPPPETTAVTSGKKSDPETLRHSPVRQFTKHRDSPVEESETEKAFQRLLQAQGNPGSVSNSGSSNNSSSNGVTMQKTVTNGPVAELAVNKDSTAVVQKPESVKSESPGGRSTPKPVSPSLTPLRASPVDTSKRPPTPKMELPNFKSESNLPPVPEPNVKKFKTLNSSNSRETSSPEENLVMDFPGIQQLQQQHIASLTEIKLVKPIPLTPQTPLVPSTLLSPPPPPPPLPPPPPPQPVLNPQIVSSSPSADNQPPLPPPISSSQTQQTLLTPKSPTVESANRPQQQQPQQQAFSPLVMQPLKSPAQPSTPAMAHTPQSEHSNPSSVAHSSPYDIDDDLMDEALVGLGK